MMYFWPNWKSVSKKIVKQYLRPNSSYLLIVLDFLYFDIELRTEPSLTSDINYLITKFYRHLYRKYIVALRAFISYFLIIFLLFR